ncbi:partial serine/threonine-protein kinase PknK, partial [Anaerolineae bacterium]
MAIELLNTKLYIPPVHTDLVPRPRLFNQLIPTATNRLVLVSAPAGYGKTTLISSWLQGNPIASVWLSLDEGDNDPIRFLQYLIKALQKIIPTLKVELPGMLQGVPSDSTMNLLLNAMAQHASPFVLVLDDFHIIQAQPILDMVTILIERTPPQMRLVLLSRTDPPLPLARWRARHQIVEIRASQLRLTKNEIACFLKAAIQLDLSDDDLGALEARTEGWIAGLQLAALSMQDRPDIHAFVTAFTGSQHYIMDYLVEEVLKRQPDQIRTFLLKTSILGRLCGALCEAVTGDTTDLTDGQAMLQELEQRNLFLIPLDGERRWYRYHHLFADMLNRHLARLMPSPIHELHRRASEWLEQNGFIPEAIQHTLMAQDTERAIRLVEQNGCLLLMAGEVVTLNRWLEAVTPFAPTHPWFAILKGWVLILTGQQDQVAPVLQVAERLLSSLDSTPTVQIMRGALATAQAQSASTQDDPVAAEFARHALACLPEGDMLSDSLRSVASLILGDVSRMNGEMEEAKHAYNEAVRIGLAADNPHLLILGNTNLTEILFEQGQLHLAAMKLSQALQMATRADGS